MLSSDIAILILRVVLGLTMAAHGYNKFFGGGRIAGTAGWFDSIGMKPGILHARVAATTEIAAGVGLAVGLLTPIPAAGFVALMLVAAWTVHRKNGFFIVKEGWEYNLVLAVSAVAIAGLGAGRCSLDHALFNASDFGEVLHGWPGSADRPRTRTGGWNRSAGVLLPAPGRSEALTGGRHPFWPSRRWGCRADGRHVGGYAGPMTPSRRSAAMSSAVMPSRPSTSSVC